MLACPPGEREKALLMKWVMLFLVVVLGAYDCKLYLDSRRPATQDISPDVVENLKIRAARMAELEAALEQKIAARQAARAAVTKSVPLSAPGKSDRPNGGESNIDEPEDPLRHEMYIAVQVRRAEIALGDKYGALFQKLGLPEHQLIDLQSLLLERQFVLRATFATMNKEGSTFLEAWSKGLGDAAVPIDQAIHRLLGDAAFAELREYNQTLGARNTVTALGKKLNRSSTPLTAAQTEAMVQLIASDKSAAQLENQMHFNMLYTGGTSISNRDVKAASTVLSAPQVDAFRQLQRQLDRGQELRTIMSQAAAR
jgi:hypothetical protein